MLTVIIYCICISTHSLTRRLTIVSENHAQSMGHFNSQPHKEADMEGIGFEKTYKEFQLTASQGG